MREAPEHTPMDPVAEATEASQNPPQEPGPLPPRDPAMTAEEWDSLVERHEAAEKEWKKASKSEKERANLGLSARGHNQPFTGTTTEDLEPASDADDIEDKADAENVDETVTAKSSSKNSSKEKK